MDKSKIKKIRSEEKSDRWRSIEELTLDLIVPQNIFIPIVNNLEKPKKIENNLIKEYHNKSIQVENLFMLEKSTQIDENNLKTKREQSFDEFKNELQQKRLARINAIDNLRNEITNLRKQLSQERELNQKLINNNTKKNMINISTNTENLYTDQDIETNNTESYYNSRTTQTSLQVQLAKVQLALQLSNADNLSLTTELGVVRKQIASLKEVIACSKELLQVREDQVIQLRKKINEIEESLADRELKIMSENLRQEYDRQLNNIRNLRQLYEERARVSAAEKENLLRQISIQKDELSAEYKKTEKLTQQVSTLESDLQNSRDQCNELKISRDEIVCENKMLKEEMAVINKLFSQMLIGFSGAESLDIDRLTTMLEENRPLLKEMATEEFSAEGACLPKLLFDIVNQAHRSDDIVDFQLVKNSQETSIPNIASAQEIVQYLPKVWRVLVELLNHQKIEQVQIIENGQSEDCYKSVQTANGPKPELSVSKTYIKLKDLILEKKSLQKDTHKLKTLNLHLERRLHSQEKRLSTVSLELTKTWHLVGKMQRQHRQLHTHEQILRYQLQQKRRLLNELKEELEYCRKKWAAARAKNDESQIQCDDLRKEFARRKLEDLNNSTESGYSDGPGSDEDDISSPKKDNSFLFTQSRKIERTKSASPNRNNLDNSVIRRGNSAPPVTTILTELLQTTDEIIFPDKVFQNIASSSVVFENVLTTATISQPPDKVEISHNNGTIPKCGELGVRLSRSKRREHHQTRSNESKETLEDMFLRISGEVSQNDSRNNENDVNRADRAERFQRLEEQCKTLIAQVVENSSKDFEQNLNPNITELQIATAENISRQEDHADRRSERLKQLEDESNNLLSKIKKTSKEGIAMKTRIDNLHLKCIQNREESVENDIEGSTSKSNPVLTLNEEDYTRRRNERLKRLENESKNLLDTLSVNSKRSSGLEEKLDNLHMRYGEKLTNTSASVDLNGENATELTENDLKIPNKNSSASNSGIENNSIEKDNDEVNKNNESGSK